MRPVASTFTPRTLTRSRRPGLANHPIGTTSPRPAGARLARMDAAHGGDGRQQVEPIDLGSVGRELRTPSAAGVAGLLFAALFSASIALLYRQPAHGSNAQEIAAWFLRD